MQWWPTPTSSTAAEEAHRKSVVLMKNTAGTLPLAPERLAGRTVYVELFESDLRVAEARRSARQAWPPRTPTSAFTTDFSAANVAVLFVDPFTGDYFHATGLLDLDIHEATNVNLAKIVEIRQAVPQLVVGLNIMLPWLLGNIEPLADALLAGFDTRDEAMFDVIVGDFAPSGRLPLTFPIDNDAIAVDEHGTCASPNDVPGLRQGVLHGRTALRLRRRRRQPLPAGARPAVRVSGPPHCIERPLVAISAFQSG